MGRYDDVWDQLDPRFATDKWCAAKLIALLTNYSLRENQLGVFFQRVGEDPIKGEV